MAIRPIDGNTLELWCEKIIDQACHPVTAQIGEVFLDKVRSAPTLTQLNEPLTLEELRLMAEPTPVWWDWVQGWVLARKGMIISWNGVYYNFEEVKGNFYRRPPEGDADA